jgi:predicted Zn-dependent peptidase
VQTDATADAVSEILGELRVIAGSRPAAEDERSLSASTLTKGYPRNFESAVQVARGLAQLAIYELPDDTFDVFSPRIQALTTDDITRAAERHLHAEQAVVVAVGDLSRIRGALEGAGLGEAGIVVADL